MKRDRDFEHARPLIEQEDSMDNVLWSQQSPTRQRTSTERILLPSYSTTATALQHDSGSNMDSFDSTGHDMRHANESGAGNNKKRRDSGSSKGSHKALMDFIASETQKQGERNEEVYNQKGAIPKGRSTMPSVHFAEDTVGSVRDEDSENTDNINAFISNYDENMSKDKKVEITAAAATTTAARNPTKSDNTALAVNNRDKEKQEKEQRLKRMKEQKELYRRRQEEKKREGQQQQSTGITNYGNAVSPSSTVVQPPPAQKTTQNGTNTTSNHSHVLATTSLPIPRDPAIQCLRLLALNVDDDSQNRIKTVYCVEPQMGDATSYPQNGSVNRNVDTPTGSNTGIERKDPLIYHVVISGDWYDTVIFGGDFFHIIDICKDDLEISNTARPINIATKTSQQSAILVDITATTHTSNTVTKDGLIACVSNDVGLLIVHPDSLVSPTKISEATSCDRRAILSGRVEANDPTNHMSGAMGNLKHAFIESLLEACFSYYSSGSTGVPCTEKYIDDLVTTCIREHSDSLFAGDLDDAKIRSELYSCVQSVVTWAQEVSHKGISFVDSNRVQTEATYYIEGVASREDNCWSAALGMKGIIDMIATSMRKDTSNNSMDHSSRYMLPIELKTGKPSSFNYDQHRAQVILYIIMLLVRKRSLISECFDAEDATATVTATYKPGYAVSHGVLLYLNAEGSVRKEITASWNDVRALMLRRNAIARDLKNLNNTGEGDISLPPLIKDTKECESCFRAAECMTYYATREAGNIADSGVPDLFRYLIQDKLSTRSLQYIQLWDKMIDLETSATDRSSTTSLVWSQSSAQREKNNDACVGMLTLTDCYDMSDSIKTNNTTTITKSIAVQSQSNGSQGDLGVTAASKPRDKDYVIVLKHAMGKALDNEKRTVEQEQAPGMQMVLADSAAVGNGAINDRDAINFNLREGDRVLISLEKIHDSNTVVTATTTTSSAITTTTTELDIEDAALWKAMDEAMNSANVDITNGHNSMLAMPATALSTATSINMSGSKWDITQSYPGVHTGTILKVEADSVHLRLTTRPCRLLKKVFKIHSSKKTPISDTSNELHSHTSSIPTATSSSKYEVLLRLDRDNNSVSTNNILRNNLYTLFMNRHDPKTYRAHKALAVQEQQFNHLASTGQASQVVPQGLGPFVAESAFDKSRAKLRRLIVEHENPSYRSVQQLEDGIAMFKPRTMALETYHKALRIYKQCASSNSQNSNKVKVSGDVEYGQNGEIRLCGRMGLTIYPGCDPFVLYREYIKLNKGQKDALKRVLCTEDYTLLQGLPGTGKTYTLSLIVRSIIARNERVLLTSYTHSAVDNLMVKLIEAGVSPAFAMRVGNISSINTAVQPYAIDPDAKIMSTGEAVYSSLPTNIKNAGGINTSGLDPSADVSTKNSGYLAQIRSRCSNARLVACTVLTAPRSQVLKYFATLADKQAAVSTSSSMEQSTLTHNTVATIFDWCVVDEAGQITHPATIGPLMYASRFMLVGDDYQLPPLVVSKEAQNLGMGVSLFKELAQRHPSAVMSLTTQYRMNSEIMSICNRLIYEHRMECGTSELATKKLSLPFFPQKCYSLPCMSLGGIDWRQQAIDPSNPVVYLSLDQVKSTGKTTICARGMRVDTDSQNLSQSLVNVDEGKVVELLVSALLDCGCTDLSKIGVISPYRAQVHYLKGPLAEVIDAYNRNHGNANKGSGSSVGASTALNVDDLDVSTVDKFQGRDKDVIILSTVRGRIASTSLQEKENEIVQVGELLRDWRRLNVAVTRARYKLIVVGYTRAMQQVPLLQEFLQFIHEQQWNVELPVNAIE